MSYFNDIEFLSCAEMPHCTAVIDEQWPDQCSVELSLGGSLQIAVDNRRPVVYDRPVLFWHHGDHRYRYRPTAQPGWWDHRFVVMRGPRALRLVELGLCPLANDHALPLRRHDEAAALFRDLLTSLAVAEGRMHAAIALDRLLVLAIEEARQARPPDRHARAIASFAAAVDADPGGDYELSTEALRTGVSIEQFRRLCWQHLGTSPLRYIRRRRLEAAARRLAAGDSVAAAAAALGYSDPAWFARDFRQVFGLSPSRVRALGWRT